LNHLSPTWISLFACGQLLHSINVIQTLYIMREKWNICKNHTIEVSE